MRREQRTTFKESLPKTWLKYNILCKTRSAAQNSHWMKLFLFGSPTKNLLTSATLKNSQYGRLYAFATTMSDWVSSFLPARQHNVYAIQCHKLLKPIAYRAVAERFLRTRTTFSHSLMVTVGVCVCKFVYMGLIFVNTGQSMKSVLWLASIAAVAACLSIFHKSQGNVAMLLRCGGIFTIL